MILCVGLSPALDVTYRLARLERAGTNRVGQVTTRAGGKAVNVARVLHALGEEVQLLTPAGGESGARFAAELGTAGVRTELVPTRIPTRRTIAVTEDDGTATMLIEPAAIDCWDELLGRAQVALAGADAVVISGVVPDGVPEDGLRTLVELAHRAGRPVLVDTSGPALEQALAARPTMIKPNADELAQLSAERDPVRAARTLARRFDTAVVASLGSDGVVAATGTDAWQARPARRLVGNPTGAGDALVAGLARGLRRGAPLPDPLPESVALSAAAVLSPHAGEVDPAHSAEQLPGVLVHPLEPEDQS